MIRWSTHLRSHFWTISSTSFEDAMNNHMDIFCRDQGFMITTFQNPFYNKLLLYIVRFFTMVQINCEHLATKTKSFAGILGYGSLTPFRAIVTWTDSDDLRPRWLLHTSNDAPYLFLCFPRLATFLKTWRHCELNLFMITSCSSTFRVITRNSFFLFFFFYAAHNNLNSKYAQVTDFNTSWTHQQRMFLHKSLWLRVMAPFWSS